MWHLVQPVVRLCHDAIVVERMMKEILILEYWSYINFICFYAALSVQHFNCCIFSAAVHAIGILCS